MTPRQKQAVELYQQGLSCSQVGKRMNCCPSAISNLLRRAGVKARPKANSDKWNARKAEIEYLYFNQDMSQEQLAAYFGVCLAMIQKVMKRLSIPRLPSGRRRRRTHYKFIDGKWNRDYRKLIVKDKCRMCSTTKTLLIHHKNDDHYDNRLENLEILCNPCHLGLHRRKWWIAKKKGFPLPKSNAPVGWNR